MNFYHQSHYGKDFFYPADTDAKKFVDAFPHSSGKRKSLTLQQLHILKEMGVLFNVEEMFNTLLKGDKTNVDFRN